MFDQAKISNKNCLFDFKGHIDYKTVSVYLRQLDDIMDNMILSNVIRKRLYSIMVECLENIAKHGTCLDDICAEENNFECPFECAEFKLEKTETEFILSAGNYGKSGEMKTLTKRINLINKLDKANLKRLYNYTIKKDRIRVKGSAGLGIIDIARASKNKIEYQLHEINKNYVYLIIIIRINTEL